MAIEQDPCGILKNSVQDPNNGDYIHECGNYVIGKWVHLTVLGRIGTRLAGTGEVIKITQPCCLACGIEPDARGTIQYEDTIDAKEARILKDL